MSPLTPAGTPSDSSATGPAGYSVTDLPLRWKVGADKIPGFLRRGELVGVNIAVNSIEPLLDEAFGESCYDSFHFAERPTSPAAAVERA